jgi:hypothetical protein
MSNSYSKKVYTATAILTGCTFALLVGFIIGLASAIVSDCFGFGLSVGAVMFLFSLDVIFRGSDV